MKRKSVDSFLRDSFGGGADDDDAVVDLDDVECVDGRASKRTRATSREFLEDVFAED